ncbi:hypothetical protein HZA87_06355 [Candidatus Uhrbacteria bacterium]|nr:hypothetical protein [Candidatus Uhrbacteria bacterium]
MTLRTLIDSLRETTPSGSSGRNRGRNRPNQDDSHNPSVNRHVFRAGLWFVVYPSSMDVLMPLRDWRDSQLDDWRQPTFHAQELDASKNSPWLSLNTRILKINPSIILVADGSNDLLHHRAKAFVDQLPPALLTKTVVLIDSERALSRWPLTRPPQVITWEELDTLLA